MSGKKAVLISIQPYWVFLIIAKIMGWNIQQRKTVEVRKNYPNAENWNKVVKIYCSKDKRSFSKIPKEYQPLMERFLGEVIGEFTCNKVECFTTDYRANEEQTARISEQSCVSLEALIEYEYNARCLFGWHISDLKVYEQPRSVQSFPANNCCPYHSSDGCTHPYHCYRAGKTQRCVGNLTRAPQSWCYVEELR